jgi:Spy/CpxP family protein refolding chaperone
MRRTTTRNLLLPALLAVAIAPMSLSAIAAPEGDSWQEQRQERFEERRQAIFERAGLDDETRSELEELHSEHMQALRELHEQHRDRMDEILDEEQREALREAKREMRQEYRAERGKERHQGLQQRLTALVDSWDLSDEEREELTELRESLYADMQELRSQSFDSREERREAWQGLRDEHKEALGELLSDEQIAEMQGVMRSGKGMGYGKRGGERRNN